MLGLMTDCLEKFVISKFGVATWESVKEEAGCDVKNDGFLKLETYHDDATVVLVECISELTELPMEEVYFEYGKYFVEYIAGQGYGNLLYCQGRTLKEWLSSINAIHNHLQTSFPNAINAPEFWCEDNVDGTLDLFYMSGRSADWAPYAKGLVKECARRQFNLDLTFDLQSLQGTEGARFTSWIVATENPDDLWKLRATNAQGEAVAAGTMPTSCPFSGMVISTNDSQKGSEQDSHDGVTVDTMSVTEISLAGSDIRKTKKRVGPFDGATSGRRASISSNLSMRRGSGHSQQSFSGHGSRDGTTDPCRYEPGSLSSATTRKLFPYHLVLDQDFAITQVGLKVAGTLGVSEKTLYNYDIDEVFQFVQPKQAKWTRSWMRKLEDQEFSLECILNSGPKNVVFKGTLLSTNPGECMLVLCPEANNLEELTEMNLTMSDLPAHGAYRDVIFLREHLSKQLNNALKMEKLSKTLQTEKELLESLLPKHAADGLREGKTVQPRIHHNVTMFFSDIVGFTNICKHIDPREVVDMLNRLYGVMDYLAKKFNLFKIETIGDAYVAASGLPDADVNHAANVANFAIAVTYCSRLVLSPLDGSPINLRIGVNSGRCCSGIVGVTNPRYCVFGDTVNTTARHESTGEAGRVHGSMTTMIELLKRAPDDFFNEPRGMVEMKGKGPIPTYWLQPTVDNALTNKEALKKLHAEIREKFKDTLKQESCLARRKKKPARKKKEDDEEDAPHATVVPGTSPIDATTGLAQTADVAESSVSIGPSSTSEFDSTTDFDASGSLGMSDADLDMSPQMGVSNRSGYTPSRNELMHMLGQFIDGGAEYDEVLDQSTRDQPSGDLTGVVDDALRILDG